MTPRNRWVLTVAVAALVVAGIGGATAAVAGSDSEQPITGDALVRASAAALAHTGGGRVSDTEVGDEDSYYEVEVTLPDGGQVDVQLDRAFGLVGSSADEPSDDGASGDSGADGAGG